MSKLIISAACIIDDQNLKLYNGANGAKTVESLAYEGNPNNLYTQLGIEYPKYYKMDILCQYGFLATEYLMKVVSLRAESKRADVGLVLLGDAGSLETDKEFVTTTSAENFFPSPANFVYTLSNIVVGEICIRNKWQGENIVMMSNQFDIKLFTVIVQNLFDTTSMNACIGGWVNVESDKKEVQLFCIERIKGEGSPMILSVESISSFIK